MPLVVSDRIQQTGTANTTVSFTLSATTTAYQSFAVVGNGNTTYYAATDGTNWEVGLGTYSTTGPTLTRTTILSSSNYNTAVTFSGTVTVWCDYPASKAVIQDSSNNVTGYAISGGTIDNTVIGATTPAAGTFNTLIGGKSSTTYVTITGDASYPMIQATGGTNTPLVLSPLGTGALQAQKTDSSTTGGNARGANAVDWQTSRTAASQVASSQYGIIGGGINNTSSGFYGAVLSGSGNNSQNTGAVISGGFQNTAGGVQSFIGGGWLNSSSGFFNIIGGGYSNATLAIGSVTTQATTIAVTASTTFYLSATNASIKVGQILVGTGITNYTYATSSVTTGTAAVMNTSTISGTTLTVGSLASGTIIAGQVLTGTGVTAGTYIVSGSGLSWVVSTSQTVTSTTITGTAYTFTISQAATTAAGVTLSFFTPHGVVVGGGNNQATGAYSFIGGGGDAGTAANRNVASGDWSAVVGGRNNTASGVASFVGGGGVAFTGTSAANTASGNYSFIGGGRFNQANNTDSVALGYNNLSNGVQSFVIGNAGVARSITTNTVFSSGNPLSGSGGQSQSALLVLGKQTTDATATVLVSDTNAASGTNQVILPNNSAYLFKCTVIAGVTGAGNTSAWKLEGAIKRGANAASTAIVGTVTTTLLAQDAGASTWTVTATADTTNGGLKITVTGQAATTIRWVAKAETAEMTY